MGMYRKEWDCCDSVTETDGWEPEHCPFCAAPERSGKLADDEAILWVESEPSTRLLDLAEVMQGTCHTVMYHTIEPRTSNPVWPLYTRPATEAASSSEEALVEKCRQLRAELAVANAMIAGGRIAADSSSAAPSDLVTKASALAALNKLDGNNSPGQLADARNLLIAAPSPTGESLHDTGVTRDQFQTMKNISAALEAIGFHDAAGDLRDIIAALATPRQTEDGSGLSAAIACSACYGTGYGVDGKPCPYGCRPAAKETATHGGVPEGWKAMPPSLTDTMRDAANVIVLDRCKLVQIYRALFLAAPTGASK